MTCTKLRGHDRRIGLHCSRDVPIVSIPSFATADLLCGDSLDILRSLPDKSVDLVFTSPPYEAARTYGIGFNLRGQAWVDWCVERFVECLRVCKGLVAWNVEGQTRGYRWSAAPALLMADLHRRSVHLRKPPIYSRYGIPGSGGKDWLRNRYEFIVCGTSGGRLPWSDNTAMGHSPRFGPGGAMSNRQVDGKRRRRETFSQQTRRDYKGDRDDYKSGRPMPKISNPGNIIDVGANTHFGRFAKENEAPFAEYLAEFFIRSFCPPGGVVLDPHCGSGTVPVVARRWGRGFIAIDVRESQIDLTRRRLAAELPLAFEAA